MMTPDFFLKVYPKPSHPESHISDAFEILLLQSGTSICGKSRARKLTYKVTSTLLILAY
jgi:hypothetical protein